MSAPAGLNTMSPAMKDAKNYHRYLFAHFEPHLGRRILEIGIGSGQYTEMMIAAGREVLGLDLDPTVIRDARARFDSSSRFEVCDLADEQAFQGIAKSFGAETVFCVNVLEHICEDEKALSNFYAVLPKGGTLLLLVPAFGFLYSAMDREAGHFRRYTKKELAVKLAAAGFSVRKNFYINLPGALGWASAKVWMSFSKPKSSLNNPSTNGLIRLYDKWITGLSRALDPLAGPVAGLSLIAVAEKKG